MSESMDENIARGAAILDQHFPGWAEIELDKLPGSEGGSMGKETAERIARGAALLDERDPGWWREDIPNPVDVDWMRMSHPGKCLLGQRCPEEVARRYSWVHGVPLKHCRFYAYAELLSGVAGRGTALEEWAVAHGFSMDWDVRWRDLTRAWRNLITERRQAAAAAKEEA
jgi:hypothetical protein